ncbi:MAG: fatty acid desaturase [Longimicrobiales bacterium]
MRVLRHSRRDALLIALSFGHGMLLLAVPSAPLIALGFWWLANTVAHNFLHLPFFRSRAANALYSAYLSLLLGLPQTLWRDRHLAHHADRPWRWRWSKRLTVEVGLVTVLWIAMLARGPEFFFGTWLLGWLGGLLLCHLQGHYEHVRGTVSHYGKLYNTAFFNDGYHVEHHTRPGLHWTELPASAQSATKQSRWPAALRWLEWFELEGLERMVLRVPLLQRFVLSRHLRAFRKVLATLPPVQRVVIIGGGLFPRTALVLQKLVPSAHVTIIDQSAENIRCARAFLNGHVHWVETQYLPRASVDVDLLIVPLAYVGDRGQFYREPPAPAVIVHDWIWRRHGRGCVISPLLLKRLNLVRA